MAILTPSQRTKSNKVSPNIPTRNSNPTGKAGSKNSNGPKGGSGKSSVPANRDSNTNKTGKVTVRTGKNNPDQIVKRAKSNNRGAAAKSHRINYSKLRFKNG